MISGSNLNISTANFKSNLTPADKTAKTNLANEQTEIAKEQDKAKEKSQIDALMHIPIKNAVESIIDIDESEKGWITKTIDKIDGILSKKYTADERRALSMKYPPETMDEAKDLVLQLYANTLKKYSKDGEPTIQGKLLGLGTKEEREELIAFKDSLPEGATMSDVGANLLLRTDISIEEFKKLYAEDIEKTTKAHKEAVAKINQEMREYNENLAKQRAEAKFKPIQATNKSKTYEDKDIRREFFENFLKVEREKGTDITEILNQLVKIGKFDVKA